MRIVCLIENTEGKAGCGIEHGLCLYVETERHKLLLDTGASELFINNAELKGVDLTKVDTVVISHGHSDHGGGLEAFSRINPTAKIYMQESAEGEYYSQHEPDQEAKYIGLAPEAKDLPQIVRIHGNVTIDEELSVFTCVSDERPIPSANRALREKKEDCFVPDEFRHEQYLVIQEGNLQVLFSGCCHHGIRNVLAAYRKLYGRDPDDVISGFHLLQRKGYSDEDVEEIVDTAHALKEFNTVFYTGHCTGEKPYEVMKGIMGDQLQYMHCGDEIKLNMNKVTESKPVIAGKKGSSGMKLHKFFAWATVGCFVMTMVTGYKHK